jgi:hypothetical protein
VRAASRRQLRQSVVYGAEPLPHVIAEMVEADVKLDLAGL